MNSIESRLKTGIRHFFKNHISISKAKIPVLIGFSGGADSLCLALLLWEEREFLGIKPALAYLDHGIRPARELEAEGKWVESFAGRLGIRLHRQELAAGSLKEEASRKGLSLEEAAREKRFDFFHRLQKEFGYRYILLGHHADDQMETLIMRFFQGGGIGGLKGIRPVNGDLLRPLLDFEKTELLSFLTARGETWITDPSNLENDFLRNRVRNNLIGEIELIFPGYRRTLKAFGDKMAATGNFIDTETDERLKWRPESGRGGTLYSIDSLSFSQTPRLIVLNSLFRLYNLTYPSRRRIPYRFLDSLPGEGGRIILKKEEGILLEGCGISIKVGEGRVFWSRDIVFPKKNSYLILINSNRSFTVSEYVFRVERRKRSDISGGGVYIRIGAVMSPLFVRSRQPGDTIHLPEGTKSLKKLYNSWGVGEADRWKIPVIADRDGILGVIGSPWGGFNRFPEIDRVKNKTGDDECFFISWSLREY